LNDFPQRAIPRFPRFVLGRLFLLAGVLAADILLLASLPHPFASLGPFARFGIASCAAFLGLGYSELKTQGQELSFGTGLFLAHLACILSISLAFIAAPHGFGFLVQSMSGHLVLRGLLLLGVALLALACIPLKNWVDIVGRTRLLWLYSIFAGALACGLGFSVQSLWDMSDSVTGRLLQIFTFRSVRAVLELVLPNINVDPDSFVIGTQRFSVFVAKECSGLEGLGLVLAFTTIWLWYFRKESRFPQALLLIPCALLSAWVLNVVRISALVLIGNAGYGDIALVGFHSQAGWIAFTTVALAFSMATRKLAWVRRIPDSASAAGIVQAASTIPGLISSGVIPSVPGAGAITSSSIEPNLVESGESPAIRAYLVPFLAILAASFLSKAASGQFEWLYPLRFLAAAIAIWHYRAELKKIDWRFDWLAPVIGAVTCAVWLIPSFWARGAEANQLGEALAALPSAARWSWIAVRVAASVLTVPIAEELAFRGYLARRIVNRAFDSVPFSAVTTFSIILSSAAFGIMHGQQWILGTFAGLAYAGVMKWKGRLSDAIVAHATSNFLLTLWVLSRGHWSQW
jgi:CAAX prenyl protease-like protein